ncbi:MAG: hypothetical protein IT373_13115 [Polyangiaceae bacterium]|nr:hypothetical protein [Polyangiaceae bacterium]
MACRAAAKLLCCALTSGLLVPSVGCAHYTSDYRPPADGRARVVWEGDEALVVRPQPAPGTAAACEAAVDSATGSPTQVRFERSGAAVGAHFVIIAPPPIVHVHTGAHYHGSSHGHGAGHTPALGHGTSGSGGKSTAPEAAVVLAVLAILAMPGITIGLAVGRPEPEQDVAYAIDTVNAYNDLARYPGTACSSPEARTP